MPARVPDKPVAENSTIESHGSVVEDQFPSLLAMNTRKWSVQDGSYWKLARPHPKLPHLCRPRACLVEHF